MNKHSYTKKHLYVGIDVHKKHYSITVVCDGEIVKRDTLTAEPKILIKYLKSKFQDAIIHSAYEAGFSGFGLHRKLVEAGVDNRVVHAASVEIGARDKVKNDKRDSQKIAVQLSVGRLKGIYVPSIEMEDRRELTRTRHTLVQDRNSVSARLKMKASYHGLIGPSDYKKVSRKWIERLLLEQMRPSVRFTIELLVDQWEYLDSKIKMINKMLREQAKVDSVAEAIYRSAPGIGPTAARMLSNELGDMSQFSSEKGLFSYTGLTPCEYSSGEKTRKGHISRQGKPMLRGILVQSAWVAIRKDASLKKVFDRISSRAGAKRAIVAVARRLIGRIRACFRDGCLYEIEREFEKAA